MSEVIKPLEEVRREIDEIDAALHDLIMRRTRVVEQVAAAKGKSNTANFIPGREAMVLRRLLARHEGAFPRHALVRMWREMVSTFAAMQGPFHVVAYADGPEQGCWDLARDHVGSHDKMTALATPRDVISKVSDGAAAIGVAPVPSAEDDDAWWRMLGGAVAPRIIARLPFIEGSNARNDGGTAYAVAKVDPDPTGDDHSLLVIETSGEFSRTGVRDLLARAGLMVCSVVSHRNETAAYLIEVEDFITSDHQSIKQLSAIDGVHGVFVIGAFAMPVGDGGS